MSIRATHQVGKVGLHTFISGRCPKTCYLPCKNDTRHSAPFFCYCLSFMCRREKY